MKNCMSEVAKLLGVELNEEFVVGNDRYRLTSRGLIMDETMFIQGTILTCLLAGELEIKHKPWKPIDNEKYYYIDENGGICSEDWWNDSTDLMRYKLGNCYRTKEETEGNVDKWKAFYASDEVLGI